MSPLPRWFEFVEVGAAVLLLGVALSAAAEAALGEVRAWRRSPSRATALAVLGAIVAAAVLRLGVAPPQLATVYIGYGLTAAYRQLLPLPHYGAGAAVFYHALLSLAGADHLVVIRANALLGVLSPLLLAGVVRALAPGRAWRAAAAAAWLVAVAPTFVRNDTSDGNNVPAVAWTLAGLVLASRARRGERGWFVPLAALGAAAATRPEFLVLAPLALGGLLAASRGARVSRLATLGVSVLVLPQLVHVAAEVALLGARSSLPGAAAPLARLAATLGHNDLLLSPRLFPVGSTAVALWACTPWSGLEPRARGVARGLVAWALLAVAATFVDADTANIARIHVPAALAVTAAAALVVAQLGGASLGARLRGGLAVAAIAATSIQPVSRLWAPTNEDAEERLVRRMVGALRADAGGSDAVLVVPLDVDAPRGFAHFEARSHYAFPVYLFDGYDPHVRVTSIAAWRRRAARSTRVPPHTYFARTVRCYVAPRPAGVPPPPPGWTLPACAAMQRDFDLVPVFAEELRNRGDVWLPLYPASRRLTVGLYRVVGRDGSGRP